MTLNHDDLKPLLTAAVADGPGDTDLLAGVRRARRRRRVLVPVASLASAGALAAGAFAVLSIGNAPSAQAQLAAAVDNTSGKSFHVHIVSGRDGEVWDGAFDPARQVGRMSLPDGRIDLYVGGTVYSNDAGRGGQALPAGKQWVSFPRTTAADWSRIGLAYELLKLGPQDPQAVLQQLKSASGVREIGTASGAGWTGHRYSFTVGSGSDSKARAISVTGSLSVDSDGLVRVLDLNVAPTGAARAESTHSVVDFSDFGTPVSVTAPPADQVVGSDQVAPAERSPGSKPSAK